MKTAELGSTEKKVVAIHITSIAKIMSHVLLIVIVSSLCGCMAASTAVSGIGARALYGKTDYNPSGNVVEVELRDTALIMDMNSELPLLPYSSLVIDSNGRVVAVIRLNYNDIKWKDYKDGMQRGEFNSNVENIEKKFDVRLEKQSTKLFLEHRYRRWYGYPAQGLLVVTIPIDTVFNLLLLGGSAFYALGGSVY